MKAFALLLAGSLWLASALSAPPAVGADGPDRIEHVVIIFMENRGFDHLYGRFPGANGLTGAGPTAQQVDRDGVPYTHLPPVTTGSGRPPPVDTRFPTDLPNAPFLIDPYVPQTQIVPSPTHLFYQQQEQINGGRMDRFAAVSAVGGLVMGHYDGSRMRLWDYARRYTLADNFFHAAFGGSFLNHIWLVCACTPRYEGAPADMVAVLEGTGRLVRDGTVTPDGYAVNTIQSVYAPHDTTIADTAKLLPPQTAPTIGDRLSDKGITWTWYAGGWNDALEGRPDRLFQFHHQPFAYFQQFADGTVAKAEHLRDAEEFFAGIDAGALPTVSFYKPIGQLDQHSGYTTVAAGDEHVADLLGRLERSPLWPRTAVIVTYDENGGYRDHVPPPVVDRWGPGARVPAIIVSPFAKKGFVDHTPYDTTSILKFLETRFGLAPLTDRDAGTNNLLNAFDF